MHSDQQLLIWVPRLRRYARALAGNRDDADDLVQDTQPRVVNLWGAGTPRRRRTCLHWPHGHNRVATASPAACRA